MVARAGTVARFVQSRMLVVHLDKGSSPEAKLQKLMLWQLAWAVVTAVPSLFATPKSQHRSQIGVGVLHVSSSLRQSDGLIQCLNGLIGVLTWERSRASSPPGGRLLTVRRI